MNSNNSQPREFSYEPPDFVPVGLVDAPWVADRWFSHADNEDGVPAYAVVVGYSNEASPHRILVRTQAVIPANAPADLATAAMLLVTGAVSSGTKPAADSYTAGVQDLISGAEHSYLAWPTVQWRLNGQPTSARVTSFGGAWAGFLPADGHRGVVVAGNHLSPDDVHLHDLESTDDFNVNFLTRQSMSDLYTIRPPTYTNLGGGSVKFSV